MKTRGNTARAGILALAVLAAGGCAPGAAMESGMSPGGMRMDASSVRGAMGGWHPAAREAADAMMAKYGAPAAMTADMMVWNRTGPWKRTIIYREAVQHDFPMPHPDVMEQFVDYRAPLDRYDELAMFDGSVVVERTNGEMSARCDKEGANFLAVNLANEIAMGQRTPADARRMYGEQIAMMKAGRMTEYTSGLMFAPPPSGNDPDRPIM